MEEAPSARNSFPGSAGGIRGGRGGGQEEQHFLHLWGSWEDRRGGPPVSLLQTQTGGSLRSAQRVRQGASGRAFESRVVGPPGIRTRSEKSLQPLVKMSRSAGPSVREYGV